MLLLSNNHCALIFRKCNVFVSVTHHSFISVTSAASSSRHGSLASLVQQRVAGCIQVFDLYLVVVHSHGSQGTCHFLLLKDRSVADVLLPPCGHILKLKIKIKWLTFTSSHSSLSSVKTRDVWRGVGGTTIDCCSIKSMNIHEVDNYRHKVYRMLTYTNPRMVHKLSYGHPLIGICLQ